MGNNIKIAGVQFAASADRDKNIARASALIDIASEEGARVIALPQLFNTRWFAHAIDEKNFLLAEKEGGPTLSAMREAAAKNGAVVVAPLFEEDSGSYYSTAFVLCPDGSITGKYRKVHVPQLPMWEERTYFKPGDLGFPVFKTPFCTLGVQICWDVFFPEGFRILALKGADIIMAPTASAFFHSHKKWERAISASAHANGVFIMRVNRVGREEKQEFYGRTFCVRPDGEMITPPSGSSTGVVIADVDLGQVSEARSEWVFFKDRRPEEYKEILEKGL